MTDVIEVLQPVHYETQQGIDVIEVQSNEGLTLDLIQSVAEVEVQQPEYFEVLNPMVGGSLSSRPNGNNPFQDTTPPPAPTDLAAGSGFSSIQLSWVIPSYSNHWYTEVWRHTADNRAAATLIGNTMGDRFTDAVDPKVPYYYWVRLVSKAEVAGPWNAIAGVTATAGNDPTNMLAALQETINESQLTQTLVTRLTGIENNALDLANEIAQRAIDEAAIQVQIDGISADLYTPGGSINSRVTNIEVAAADPISGFEALALRASQVETNVTSFDADLTYHFDDDVEGWTANNTTGFAQSGGVISGTSSTTDPQWLSPAGLTINGSTNPFIHAKIRRVSGTGTTVKAYFVNDLDTVFDENKSASFALPVGYQDGDWAEAVFDFGLHGSWGGRTITQFRIDPTDQSGDVWEIDWVSVGRRGPTNNKALIQESAQSINGLEAHWALKIDVNGNVAGIGLASGPAQADGTESEFTVLADKFSILHPNADDLSNPKLAFTVFNGKTVMDAASIINLGAQDIEIATTGTIRGGQTDYAAGTGFFLGYSGGQYKFSIGDATDYLRWDGANLSFSGDLSAASGTFAGALSAATGTFAGSLSAATGSFAGSLSAATGSFSGVLTASAINAVNTINIAGNAVNIPVSAYTAAGISCNFTWTTVASLSIASTGAPIDIYGQASGEGGLNWLFEDSYESWGMDYRLLYEGSVVMEGSFGRKASSNGERQKGIIPMAYRHTPGAGTRNYYLQVRSQSNYAGTVTYRYLRAMEVKR